MFYEMFNNLVAIKLVLKITTTKRVPVETNETL